MDIIRFHNAYEVYRTPVRYSNRHTASEGKEDMEDIFQLTVRSLAESSTTE